jgi:hypothetical protein
MEGTEGGLGIEGAEAGAGIGALGTAATGATEGGLGTAETAGLGMEGTAEGFNPAGEGGTTALLT